MEGAYPMPTDEAYIPLTEAEINEFFDDLDRDKDGYVAFEELEAKVHQVHDEIAPDLQKHHILHPSRHDIEKAESHSGDGLHAFLCHIMPDCGSRLNREDFTQHIQSWRVPSQKQSDTTETDKADRDEERRIPRRRRLRAYWAVHGPNILFITFVVACMVAFGVWQMVIYIKNQPARQALGWGVILAKACAGVLYPTLVFMLLSMSRHLSTWIRYHSYVVSRVINWDYSQKFHIIMSCAGLFFASLHAIGHLTGSMLYGSRPAHQAAVAAYLGEDAVPRYYITYIRSLPGWTGIVALGLFWTITLLSLPWMRRRSYEVFQCGHLLMFPMIGLLCAHGTSAYLQAPMLGYFLAFPAALVIYERINRVALGFTKVPATMNILDHDAIAITCKHPRGKDWKFSAGQYVLLQVPEVSFFQWHPFTISSCRGNELQVHIKLEGDWTQALKDKLTECEEIRVAIDGPFGAPAQRFYDYDYSIIIGGGIGITPFSAILTDLEENTVQRRDPWEARRSSRSLSRPSLPSSNALVQGEHQMHTHEKQDTNHSATQPRLVDPERRVDFHWTVREKNNLLWFSDLLNRAIIKSGPLRRENKLELNINTHITAKRKNISTYVFRFMLDGYRTQSSPYSALTGLKQRSHFRRPDFKQILERHFQDMVDDGSKVRKVGVFYCGTPVVGEILSDTCHELTARARDMGLKVRYDFLMEVFG